MNERIQELLKQARLDVILNEHAHEYGNGYMENTPYPEIEKFAELIVRECIELNRQELAFNAFERMLNKYKDHFGVE
jgi:hypothetical protein